MRVAVGVATALLLCLVLAKSIEGSGRAYAGAPYKYDNKYDNKYSSNQYGQSYNYGNGYNGHHYYPTKYGQPSKPCYSYKNCHSGYYFDVQTCSCVPFPFIQLPEPPAQQPPRPPLPPPLPPRPLPTIGPPTQLPCPLTQSRCPVPSRQRVNQLSCTCECIVYSVLVPGTPAIPPVPGRFTGTRGTGTRGTGSRRTGSRRTSRGSRRSSRDAGLELEVDGMNAFMDEFEDRSRRSHSRSGSRRGSSRGSSSRGTSRTGTSRTQVFVPGRPGVPAVQPSTRLVLECPAGTQPIQSSCTCQ